jgi:hypothetical protein
MAGGYARNVEDTVEVHFQSIKHAASLLGTSITTDGRTHQS